MYNRIIQKLQSPARCTPSSLAEELEIDERTVRRHLQALREMGAPIIYDRLENRYRLSQSSWQMPNLYLTMPELEAMALALRSLGPLIPEPFTQPMRELFDKLLDALPSEDREQILRTSAQVTFAPVPVPSKGTEHVQPLWQAIRDHLRVHMKYYSASTGRDTTRQIDPYHLRYFSGCWYVIGYDHLTGYWPVFSLARIRELNITQDPFVPRQFDTDLYFRNSFGIIVGGVPKPVRIRLTGYAARTADEKVWPAGFVCEPDGDDAVIISGTLSNHGDLLPWIAMQQGDAEILTSED